jgi:MSHA type pilus biogenesis protein MshL
LTLPQEFSPSPDTKENAVSKWDALPAESPVLLAGSVSAPGALSDELNTVKIDHLELKDMDIMDVLKLIAQKTGLNIIVGKGVQGKVTIYLNGVSATEALRIILDANGLAYKYDDGIVRVMTAQEYERRYGQVFGGKSQTKVYHLNYAKAEDLSPLIEHLKSSTGKIISDLKSNTIVVMDARENAEMIEALIREVDIPVEVEVFELNYAKAEDIVAKIEPLITQSVGSVRFDERSNKIIVTDKPSKMGVIARLIREFDVQDRQVLIEAKIVQIQLSDSYELGVDWKAVFPGMDDLTAQSDFDVISNSESNRGKLQIGTITTNNYTAMIEALQTIGKTNVLSSPSITVVNNQEAKILVGTTQPYVTTTTTTPASGPTTVSESVNFIEVGVKLYVVPTIHSDGFITMKIKPEVSTALTPITTGQNNEIPVVETSEAETIVRIKDGVTVVIGGLIKDEKRSTIKKVPLLGNVPLLGKFFRNTDDSVVKTEIAIFLTPRVMIGDQQEQHSFITEKK